MSTRAIHVGDTVQFQSGGRSITGQVREDRGPIGVGGRRLYLVIFEMGKDCWYRVELPAAELEVIEPKNGPA
jgi:hypothetical protein